MQRKMKLYKSSIGWPFLNFQASTPHCRQPQRLLKGPQIGPGRITLGTHSGRAFGGVDGLPVGPMFSVKSHTESNIAALPLIEGLTP